MPQFSLKLKQTGPTTYIAYPTGTVHAEKIQGDTAQFGGTTHYSEFEADGTLKMNGNATVFRDINLGGLALGGPAASLPTEVKFLDKLGADTGIYTYGFAIGEQVAGVLELQHDYKEGSDITPHVHWQGITAPGGGTDNVKWELTYTTARDGSTLSAVTVIVKESAITTQYSSNRSDFTAITGTSFKIGDQLIFMLKRIAASADDYAGDALLETFGIHYEIDTIGSRSIVTK